MLTTENVVKKKRKLTGNLYATGTSKWKFVRFHGAQHLKSILSPDDTLKMTKTGTYKVISSKLQT